MFYGWNSKGSRFESGEDDFITGGEGFATLAEAQADLLAYKERFPYQANQPADWFVLFSHTKCEEKKKKGWGTIVDLGEVTVLSQTQNPGKRKRDTGDDWRREQAMQIGMAFGCQGYNDAMGW